MTRNTLKNVSGLVAILGFMAPAWGDTPKGIHLEVSCQWSDPPVAKAALALLKIGDTVHLYCKTCGDRMSTPVTVTSAEVVATPVAMKQVNMNGGMLDLALVYVRNKPTGAWTNVANLTKCGSPTSNPNTLPAQLVSSAQPGALPYWWQAVQDSAK